MQSPPFPIISSLLGPNILLNTLFSNTLSFLSSRNVNDQVSHPYKTTGKIIINQSLHYVLPDLTLKKTGNVHINLILMCICATIAAVEK